MCALVGWFGWLAGLLAGCYFFCLRVRVRVCGGVLVCFGFMLPVDALCVCATSVRVRLRLEVFVGLGFVGWLVCFAVWIVG